MTPPVSSFLQYVILLTLIKLGYRCLRIEINNLKLLNHKEDTIYLLCNFIITFLMKISKAVHVKN